MNIGKSVHPYNFGKDRGRGGGVQLGRRQFEEVDAGGDSIGVQVKGMGANREILWGLQQNASL